jgi:hypothetical protein
MGAYGFRSIFMKFPSNLIHRVRLFPQSLVLSNLPDVRPLQKLWPFQEPCHDSERTERNQY